MDRFKKITVTNLRKMIKNEGFKKDKNLKGYSYKKKKDLVLLLVNKNIPDEVLDKYRKKNKKKIEKEEVKEQVKEKPEYIIKHLIDGKIVTGRIYTNKERAIKHYEESIKKNTKHNKCMLFVKKGKKLRLMRHYKHKNKLGETFDKIKKLMKNKKKY